MTGDVCTSNATDLPLGVPCPECGHTRLVHPGSHNPGLNACVLCLLLWSAPEPPSVEPRVVIHEDNRLYERFHDNKLPSGVNVREPIPVGAVKLHPIQGTIWVKLGELSGWQCVGNQAPRPITATADVVESWPVVGAVPFSPAAAWWDQVRKGRS